MLVRAKNKKGIPVHEFQLEPEFSDFFKKAKWTVATNPVSKFGTAQYHNGHNKTIWRLYIEFVIDNIHLVREHSAKWKQILTYKNHLENGWYFLSRDSDEKNLMFDNIKILSEFGKDMVSKHIKKTSGQGTRTDLINAGYKILSTQELLCEGNSLPKSVTSISVIPEKVM